MELYASRRLMLDCRIAAKLPTIIVARAQPHTNGIQLSAMGPSATWKTRSRMANAAALGPTERNAATGAGAPWYTSGAQTWNGAAEILKAKPTNISAAAAPTSAKGSLPVSSTRRISLRLVDPVAP